ncbi:hypothetical protein K8S19_09750 [bacterium]|nr:hypothetical protein [bacterium]
MPSLKKSILPFIMTFCLAIPILAQAVDKNQKKNAEGIALQNYSEIVVENLSVGGNYSMINLVNLPLKIINKNEAEVKIRFKILFPTKNDLREGFEPIPDPKWIIIAPTETNIAAKETYSTDVLINIPDDKKYLNKKYQVEIVAEQVPAKGHFVSIALAVKGHVMFTVAPQKMTKKELMPSKINMNFDVANTEIVMSNLRVGKKTHLRPEDKKKFEIQNQGKEKIKFLLASIDPSKTIIKPNPGYEMTPDASWLTFEKEECTLKGGQKRQPKAFITIPDTKENRDKKYEFIIEVTTGAANSGSRYVRVLVTTKK